MAAHPKSLGIVGGGQLGRMIALAAMELDVKVVVVGRGDPCGFLESGGSDLLNADDVASLAACDGATIEVEEVSVEGLERIPRIVPRAAHVRLIQDKGLQKEFFSDRGIPTADFSVSTNASIRGFPVVQKLRRGGYDGRGVKVLRSPEDAAFSGECLLEDLIDVKAELSVIVARDETTAKTYPCVEQVFTPDHLAAYIVSPAPRPERLEAERLASRVAEEMDFVGLLAVEFFLEDGTGRLLVNEVAPRPHNSGHHTIEANATSQFHQITRIALGLALGDTTQTRPFAATVNLLGGQDSGVPEYQNLEKLLATPDVYPHIYGKTTVSPNRKMGHVTVLADDLPTLRAKVDFVRANSKVIARPP
ncbi:hypothetical protein CTAYLR_004123 [Chrysophaeum taylorii]|uniref:ATP-grasp domain-containing protein n=1 Tax=Chrysophaeum taylorii TaxID=2483200 RepID=A0AAD7UD23_9STRA|nr:hypothetical protein CTAYLR_004123 [Chrysophaeum taylorii]